jgi:pilus assembly protein Flp/PilA
MQKILALATAHALYKSKQGVTAIEYGLIAGFIALVIIGGITAFGTELGNFFNRMATQVQGL